MSGIKGDFLSRDNFYLHDYAENESGYNYRGFINRSGQSFIMREKTDETEYRYSAGGISLSAWANRGTLTYTNLNNISID